MNHLKLTEVDQLLNFGNSKIIEAQLIDYIMSLRQAGIAYSTIKHLVAPLFTFYTRNDVILNRKKVFDYLGEIRRAIKDGAYTLEQIQTALQNADQRMKMIILLLASTGARVGALPGLTLGNLQKLPDYGLYKIIFYEGSNSEYYTFTTRECAQAGIDNYLLYRKRCGEKLAFDPNLNRWTPGDAPLIRLSFDMNDPFQASRQVIPIRLQGLRQALTSHLIKCGLRQQEHPTERAKRIRKPISLSKGFRKFVIGIFIQANLNHEIRELLSDHATQLDQSYFRPTEKQVLEEYLKAEPYLTISNELRLQEQVDQVRVNKNEMEEFRQELAKLKELLFKG